MKQQFVTYEIALMLKEKGFDEPCFGTYNSFGDFIQSNSEEPLPKNSDQLYDHIWLKHIQTHFPEHTPEMLCTAPLWQQAIDWLREKRNIHIVIARNDKDLVDFATSRGVTTMLLYRWYFVDCYINVGGAAESYHEARQAAIEHALTLI